MSIEKEKDITAENNSNYLEIIPGQLEKSKELSEKIAAILDDKKARNVKIIETGKQTIIADYFVIATGTSSTHIKSLAGEVEFQLEEKYNMSPSKPSRISGADSGDWIILDYDSVLTHIFNSEARDYYKLEKLWGDGGISDVNLEEMLKPEPDEA